MTASAQADLLVVEDDPHLADQLRWALKKDYRVTVAGERDRALDVLRHSRPDLLLLDLCLPPGNAPDEGFRVLEAARSQNVMTIVMSAVEEREAALRAIAEGAYDFFSKPVDLIALRIVVARALERQALERENRLLREQLRQRFRVEGLIGVSAAMRDVLEAIRRVADSPVSVMLEGESGTGKGLVASAIHYHGRRRDGPFVAVHCAALPETLLEAELFGHEKGAFTGAASARIGRFEAASGGTLFLDEVACLTPAIQIKLLRVLEDRAVERLGSNRARDVDIRLITASNQDLEEKVRRGEFREDFYFRIKVFPIRIAPLRERPEDIPLLAEHLLKQACAERGGTPKRLSERAREELARRSWPGNVRELRNAVEILAHLTDADTIEGEDVARACPAQPGWAPAVTDEAKCFKDAVDHYQKQLLLQAISRANGVKAHAARQLELDPWQMKYLVRKYGL